MARRETFELARQRLFVHLAAQGWTIKANLKVPQACREHQPTLFFHPQAVYLGVHSLFLDIRGMAEDEFLSAVNVRLEAMTPLRRGSC